MGTDKLLGDYYTKKSINIQKYLTKEHNEILKKLDIVVENTYYSNFEFARINSKLIRIRKQRDLLNSKNIDYNKYMELLDVFDKIQLDYNL